VIQKFTRFVVAVILVAAPLASVARAQLTTATIVGTITDSSGAALPGATVTAQNLDTGLTRSVPSGGDGAYRLEFIPIGRYAVDAVLDGFKTARHSGIILRVNDTARVDVSLEIGALAETVADGDLSVDVGDDFETNQPTEWQAQSPGQAHAFDQIADQEAADRQAWQRIEVGHPGRLDDRQRRLDEQECRGSEHSDVDQPKPSRRDAQTCFPAARDSCGAHGRKPRIDR